ncbi:MAG: ABC transporter ATP-binding protein/permease [Lachnospiraceae bacterium]|nr:ABC transporter ATP-binding protein/permease [Lachnospiraceae bacterium]
MKRILDKLKVILDSKQKTRMKLLVVLMVIGALLETVSIALVLPIATVLLNQDSVNGDGLTARLYHLLGFTSVNGFAIFLLFCLLAAFIVKNSFLFFETRMQLNFVYDNQFETSRKMMINYMKRPYEYYLNAETSVIQRNITSDVNNMYAMVLSILQLMSESVVALCMGIYLVFQDPIMCVTIGGLLIILLLVIRVVLKPIMVRTGKENQDYYAGLFKWINQSVTGIKEIKIANKESYFIHEYAKCGNGYVRAVKKSTLLNSTPRLLIETVVIAGFVLYMYVSFQMGRGTDQIVASVSAFAVAAMKLLPSANRINNYMTNISYYEPFFFGASDNLQADISDKSIIYDADAYTGLEVVKKLPVKKSIVMQNVCYKYPNTDVYIFRNMSMEIPIGKSVGIVGTSGAGKTTVVDIMLGLLEMESGKVLADGVDVNLPENYQGWLANVGYIPQTIFMLDSNIRENVAFGVPREHISEEQVWAALHDAQLDTFVRGLPEGLDTQIGERGIRLSGGQRQRIGIARALFWDPEVLVLDEATSALDNDTEAAIMESINHLHGRKTLLIIAHRLQTIEKCDMIYRIQDEKAVRER